MADDPPPEPRRFLLRPAGALTQLCSAGCLLLGTIAFVLAQQNKAGGTGLVVVWAVGAMAGLVFGGLMPRGGLVSLFASAALMIAAAVVLIVIDFPTLRAILRVLPEDDVEMIGNVLVGGAVVMLATALLCLASLGQARRYAKAFAAAVAEAAAHDPAAAQSFQAMKATVDPTTPIIPTAASTNKGWTPHKATGYTTMIIIRPPKEEARSRRRIYFALGGAAIGVGAGIGVLVSGHKAAPASSVSAPPAAVASAPTGGGAAKAPGPSTPGPTSPSSPGPSPAAAPSDAGTSDAGTSDAAIAAPDIAPSVPVRDLLAKQHAAMAKADGKALVATYAADAFAFGVDANDVVEGRDAIEELMNRQLGDAPPDGFTVSVKFTATGGIKDVAWTAEDLELAGPGVPARHLAVTQVARFAGGAWTVVAVSWGAPVADAVAERAAVLGTMPRPKAVPNKHDGAGDLDWAVRAAFASRTAFAGARSEREDGFNFGSGPGERVVGGVAIKRLFGRIRAELKLDGSSARVSQLGPDVGWAAVNVVFTQKGQAATDVAQTFRVLAVMVKEDGAWHIVQTQFSNGGPVR